MAKLVMNPAGFPNAHPAGRLRKICFTPDLLLRCVSGTYEVVREPVPEDAQCCWSYYDWIRNTFCVVLAHPSWRMVAADEVIPEHEGIHIRRVEREPEVATRATDPDGEQP